jgi:hypothetical protein
MNFLNNICSVFAPLTPEQIKEHIKIKNRQQVEESIRMIIKRFLNSDWKLDDEYHDEDSDENDAGQSGHIRYSKMSDRHIVSQVTMWRINRRLKLKNQKAVYYTMKEIKQHGILILPLTA